MVILIKKGNVRSVLAFGNFDGVHLGHQLIIDTVKDVAFKENLASTIITFDPHPSEYLRNRRNFLLLDLEQKVYLLQNCGIDYLYIINFDENFSQLSPDAFIEYVLVNSCNVKYIVMGHNCFFGHRCLGNIDLLRYYSTVYNYKIVKVDPVLIDDVLCSSSLIRECLSQGRMDFANKVLGRSYQINGKVMKGLARGRLIGFPTVNVSIEHMLVPKVGVYSARIRISDSTMWLNGIVNIGLRPTFNDIKFPILEMHIFDFDDDIYDQLVSVQLLEFVRSEFKFSTVEELKQQIKDDISKVKKKL
ncbi:MAG: bifunctional riboflavin kinase/FAD synthetase [Ehrlichia sp.]